MESKLEYAKNQCSTPVSSSSSSSIHLGGSNINNVSSSTTGSNVITNNSSSTNKKNNSGGETGGDRDDQCTTITSNKIDGVVTSSPSSDTVPYFSCSVVTSSNITKYKTGDSSSQLDHNNKHGHLDENKDPVTSKIEAGTPTSPGYGHSLHPSVSNVSSTNSYLYRASSTLVYGSNTYRPTSSGATPSAKTSTVGANNGSLGIGGGPYNWQVSKTSVKERLAYLFNSDVMSDVHFRIGKPPNSQVIPAHKFVLSVGSAVFDALFSWMKASNSSTENLIEIPDVEPAAFLALLRFLYCDEVQIDPETVMTTLYAAKKYSVPALEKACVDFLKRNLSSDNAFMLLTQARLFDEPQLAALCLETIDKNTTEALAADGFTDIDLDTMCVVLERNSLGIRECKLFSAVCRWAEAECSRQDLAQTPSNQRKVLGAALHLIRFPLMSVEEFAMGSAQTGILVDREVVELFLHFTVNPKPAIGFSDVPRCCLTGKEQVVLRFCQIESRWGYSGTSDRIRFMVNRRIFVVGFGLYGSIHGPTEYLVNIELLHTDTGRVVGQNDTSFQCDGSTSTFRVLFKKPVEILPNTSYTACSTLKGPDSYYGSRGLRKVTHESVSSGKVTFQFSYATGNNNGTSVEDGQIPEIIFYT